MRINQGQWAAHTKKIQSNKQTCHRTNIQNDSFISGFISRYLIGPLLSSEDREVVYMKK